MNAGSRFPFVKSAVLAVLALAMALGLLVRPALAAPALGSILLYQDGYNNYAGSALNNLGYTFTEVTDPSLLSNALTTGGPWDLVVVDAPSTGINPTSLTDFISGGGRVILSYWDLDAETDLAAAFGVTPAGDFDVASAVFRWDVSHPLFTNPQSVPDLTTWDDNYGDKGDWLTVNSGTAVAGFAHTETAGQAGIVIGNDGRTIVNSFLWDESNQDDNGNGVQDVVELIENEITFVLTSSAGSVGLDRVLYGPSQTVQITVGDTDLNTDPTTAETATAYIGSTTETSSETITCTETGVNTGVFRAYVGLEVGDATADGTLQVHDGDTITALYIDADDGAGNTDVNRMATAEVDAAAPVFDGLIAVDGYENECYLQWSGAIDYSPVEYLIYRATTSGGQDFTAPPYATTTEPDFEDYPIDGGVTYYYVVRARDAAGNVDDNTVELSGTPTGRRLIFTELLDSDPGWSCEGDWAFGQPTGWYDPPSGFTGSNVYGYNLAGNYPDNMATTEYLTTGPIDISGYVDVVLTFQAWLGVESNVWDTATVEASTNGTDWTTVWENGGGTMASMYWSPMALDLSSVTNGHSTVYLRWGMGPTDTSLNYCGWNIDDIRLLGFVASENRPPVLDPVGSKSVNEGSALSFTLTASDPDYNPVTFSATGMPDGATLNPTTGAFSWTPSYTQAGIYSVTVSASDGSLSDSVAVSITVNDVNVAPVLDPIGSKSVDENTELTFTLTGSDPGGDTVTFVCSNLPSGATLDASTGVFAWTPSYSQSGTYNLAFGATDGTLTDWETVVVTVSNVNRPPVLDPIGDQSVAELGTLTFTVHATDPDGNPLTYSATGLPLGATLDSYTGVFTWTPAISQAGSYPVHIVVDDGWSTNNTDSEDITITVNQYAIVPTIKRFAAPKSIAPGSTKTFTAVVQVPYTSDVTVVLNRVSPDPAEIGRQTVHLSPNSRGTVSFDYTFRADDAPTVTFELVATTPSGGSASVQASTKLRVK